MARLDRHYQHWPKGLPHHLALPDQTLFQNLENTARARGDYPAILYYGFSLSYGELLCEVEALAGYLQHTAGVSKGDRVLLYMQNAPQFIIAYYAILRADAVVVPINPMSRDLELEHYAQDAGAKVVLCGQELMPQVRPLIAKGHLHTAIVTAYACLADPDCDIPLPAPLRDLDPADIDGPGMVRWCHAISAGQMPGPHLATPDDLAVIPYSSGTTGHPKGCMHSHRTAQSTALASVIWNPMTPKDVTLAVLPLFHVVGMQSAMNGPIFMGGSIVVMTRWDRAQAARLIARHRVTRWRSIATMAIDLVNDPDLDRYDLSSLTAIGGGGAAMPAAIAQKLKDKTGLDYIEGYGLSETIAATHINPPRAAKQQCLGIPVFDVDARVISPETGQELGPGNVGEIILAGPQIFLGYWGNPDATKAAFLTLEGKAFLRSGDLGYYDDDGYFFMVDRVKRMINTGGFKVWPAEVENLMYHCPEVAEVCVIGLPDPRRGETVMAVVVPQQPEPDAQTAARIQTWCRAHMAAFKVPQQISFALALPKSGSGKVLWRRLQAQHDPLADEKTQPEVANDALA